MSLLDTKGGPDLFFLVTMATEHIDLGVGRQNLMAVLDVEELAELQNMYLYAFVDLEDEAYSDPHILEVYSDPHVLEAYSDPHVLDT